MIVRSNNNYVLIYIECFKNALCIYSKTIVVGNFICSMNWDTEDTKTETETEIDIEIEIDKW